MLNGQRQRYLELYTSMKRALPISKICPSDLWRGHDILSFAYRILIGGELWISLDLPRRLCTARGVESVIVLLLVEPSRSSTGTPTSDDMAHLDLVSLFFSQRKLSRAPANLAVEPGPLGLIHGIWNLGSKPNPIGIDWYVLCRGFRSRVMFSSESEIPPFGVPP